MKLFEVACNAVVEAGVDRLFGLMGDGNMNIITTLEKLDVAFVSSRHETGAIAAADGYARASGLVGVCTVTQGPGLTNAVTALVTARKARSPLVLFVGDTGAVQRGWPQDIDQENLLAAIDVPVTQLTDRRNVLTHVRDAFETARAQRRPVAVNCPLDTQLEEWDPWDVDTDYTPPAPVAEAATDTDVARAVDLLQAAKRPVIVAGKGAFWAGAGDALRLLGGRIGALLATTLPAKGMFAGDPYDIGIAGSLGTGLAASLIGRADVVLAVGASLNDFTTMRHSLFPESAAVVRVDRVDDPGPNRYPAKVTLRGDAEVVTHQLLAGLGGTAVGATGFRSDDVAATIREHDSSQDFVDRSEPNAMDPRSLMLALDKTLPAQRQIVTDVGHFFGFPATYLRSAGPGTHFAAVEFGAVGVGLGTAIGAATARPDLTTVLFVGDGGLMMSLPDLDTAARAGVRLVVVVLDDGAYGSELQMLRNWKMSESASVFATPDLAAVARDLGVPAATATTIDEVTALGGELAELQGPFLLRCMITQNVVADWLAGAFER